MTSIAWFFRGYSAKLPEEEWLWKVVAQSYVHRIGQKKVNSGKMRSATLRACRRFRRQWWLQSWWPSEAAATIEAAMCEDISQLHGEWGDVSIASCAGRLSCVFQEKKNNYFVCECLSCVSQREEEQLICVRDMCFMLCCQPRRESGEKFGGPCRFFGVRDMCAREVCLVCFSEKKNNVFVCETCVSCCVVS